MALLEALINISESEDFSSDNYKIIDKQYGKINNIFRIENNFYIHTDNTILCINKDNTIKANNTDIQISTRDLFEGEPIEVLVGNHGFGGMQTEDSWCLNQIGYFYLDKDSKRSFSYHDILTETIKVSFKM